ncbi:MAG: J domain-containing protein [Anaeromyxobacter sp.]
MPRPDALAPAQALVRTSPQAGPRPSVEAEARLRALLEEIAALDLELEQRSTALAEFSRGWERALGGAFADLSVAERLVLRLQRLEDALLSLAVRLKAGEPSPPRPRRRRSRKAARGGAAGAAWARDPADDAQDPSAGEEPADQPEPAVEDLPPELEAEEVALKRLYRRLARVLHPDLASDPAEQARLSDLMARVNEAYARGDRTALEVMAERVGAGEPPGELTEEARLAHLETRIATLSRIAASLARERERLLRCDTERLRAEAARRAEAGGDMVAENRRRAGRGGRGGAG